MITFFIILFCVIFIVFVWYVAHENQRYIDDYNKRYIEKIKQNVAKSLVKYPSGKKWLNIF